MYLDQLNRSCSTSHPSIIQVTTTINKLSVETPIITPTPSPVQNYNPTFLTLQPGECAMCGQLKSIHPDNAHYSERLCVVHVNALIMRRCSTYQERH